LRRSRGGTAESKFFAKSIPAGRVAEHVFDLIPNDRKLKASQHCEKSFVVNHQKPPPMAASRADNERKSPSVSGRALQCNCRVARMRWFGAYDQPLKDLSIIFQAQKVIM